MIIQNLNHAFNLDDATKSSWASPPKKTDCTCMFKYNCSKQPTA
jgi:hypothetical protein